MFTLFCFSIKLSPEAVPTLKPPPVSSTVVKTDPKITTKEETSKSGTHYSTATFSLPRADPKIFFSEFLNILRELESPPWTKIEDENILQVLKVQSLPPACIPVCACQLIVFKNSGELTLKKFGKAIDLKTVPFAFFKNGQLKLTESSVNALLNIMFKISEKDLSKHYATQAGQELIWKYKVKVQGW